MAEKREFNADNNLWYEGDKPVDPEQLEQENSTATTTVPQDSGQTDELLRQIQELREQISQGRAETQAVPEKTEKAPSKAASDKDKDISL